MTTYQTCVSLFHRPPQWRRPRHHQGRHPHGAAMWATQDAGYRGAVASLKLAQVTGGIWYYQGQDGGARVDVRVVAVARSKPENMVDGVSRQIERVTESRLEVRKMAEATGWDVAPMTRRYTQAIEQGHRALASGEPHLMVAAMQDLTDLK